MAVTSVSNIKNMERIELTHHECRGNFDQIGWGALSAVYFLGKLYSLFVTAHMRHESHQHGCIRLRTTTSCANPIFTDDEVPPPHQFLV